MKLESMANSKYEYVKAFEQSDALLPHTWIVIRVDGRGFTRFAQAHDFEKPNDKQALLLMNECAKAVSEDLPEVVFAYGVSDEFRSVSALADLLKFSPLTCLEFSFMFPIEIGKSFFVL